MSETSWMRPTRASTSIDRRLATSPAVGGRIYRASPRDGTKMGRRDDQSTLAPPGQGPSARRRTRGAGLHHSGRAHAERDLPHKPGPRVPTGRAPPPRPATDEAGWSRTSRRVDARTRWWRRHGDAAAEIAAGGERGQRSNRAVTRRTQAVLGRYGLRQREQRGYARQ